MNSLLDISDCFEVTFLQEPRNQQKLDVLESMWRKLTPIKQFYRNITKFAALAYCFFGLLSL